MLPYVKIYQDFIEILRELSDEERGRLFLAIMQFAAGEEILPLTGPERIAFVAIRNQLERDMSSYEGKREALRKNGQKGGRPPKAGGAGEVPDNLPADSDVCPEAAENQRLFSETKENQSGFPENLKSQSSFLENQTKPKKTQEKEEEKEKEKEGFPPYPPTGERAAGKISAAMDAGASANAGPLVSAPSPANAGASANAHTPANMGPSANAPPPVSAGPFEQFWQAYPKKVGKQAALKAFQRVKVPLKTLLSAVEQQKGGSQWNKEGGRYIPNPATWLGEGRWDDELPEEAAPPGVYIDPGRERENRQWEELLTYGTLREEGGETG